MEKKIAVIPGDGIGKEVTAESLKILKFLIKKYKLDFTLKNFNLGAEEYLKTGIPFPEEIKQQLKNYDAIFFGAIGDPRVQAGVLEKGILLEIRFYFDLYVNLRPIKLLSEDLCPLKNKTVNDINFIVVRENTEGMYAGVGGFFKKNTLDETALQIEVNTYKGIERILDFSFKLAEKRNKKLCMSDKSNVLTYGHNLWQRVFSQKQQQYNKVKTSHLYIDALGMQMIKAPEQFDVIVTNNLFGDIITDLGAQLQGGMGVAASANINPDGLAMFEPVHGSAPDIAGKGIANPIASLLTLSLMLDYFDYKSIAKEIEDAVTKAINTKNVTPELGGNLTTQQVGDFILKQVSK